MLPLLNSAFKPGTAVEVVERFEDSDFRNIARAELFYFSGRAKECCEIAESYLEDEAIELRLSACILYGYSNLSLGNSAAARRGLEGIQECMKLVKREGASKEVQAVCVLAGYAGVVLLHLPTERIPSLEGYCGMCKAALLMTNDVYPISMIYIRCMMAMCRINRKDMQESQSEFMKGWNLAKMDNFIEPFIEHHGLLRGLVEACIRKNDPDGYRKITDGVLFFSRGWMVIHNNETKKKVTNELSTMEFSIAMLAGEGWTNKEISAHLGISVNTVKHYLTDIFSKLNVKKRDELKNYMLK